jgi:hypothetical protein
MSLSKADRKEAAEEEETQRPDPALRRTLASFALLRETSYRQAALALQWPPSQEVN